MNCLAELFLSNNSLTILKEDTVEELISLEELEISINKIIAINRNVFKGLPKLKVVYIKDNPISLLASDSLKALCNSNCEIII